MEQLRVAFIQSIVDPVSEAWFRHLARDRRIVFRVFALRRRFSHRPGWESRRDAGYEVDILPSLRITRYLRFEGSTARTFSIRLIPVNLLWKLWRFRPHVIAVSNVTDLIQAAIYRSVSGAKIVGPSEDTELSFSRMRPLRRWLKTQVLKSADVYCARSSAARDLLLSLGIPHGRIAWTPWAVDNQKFSSWAAEADIAEVRRKLNVDGIVFVTVAALIPRKGIDQLLVVWRMIPAELRRKGSLVIVGDGEERARLAQFAHAHGLTNVRFVGHLAPKEVAACLGASDVFVLPTLEDLWGFAVNEAMAVGLPVLCSKRAASAQDLVRQGVNGFVFDPLDREGFCALLRDALECPERLAEMGSQSRKIIADFTIDRSVASLAEALLATAGRPDLDGQVA
jgi:glycosyltransferase involved in cell wall biosynthesis